MLRKCTFLLAAAIASSLVGCAPTAVTGPEFLSIDRIEYARAFDAAVALAADMGMPADVQDRDAGVIETRPKVAGSLIEPWNWPNGSVSDAAAGTIAYERRRARFEFLPSGFRPEAAAEDAMLLGRRTPGSVDANAGGAIDLSRYDGPVEVRVSVYIERAFTPGLQRSTWTLSGTSFSTDPLKLQAPRVSTTFSRSVSTPIERDAVMERQVLQELREHLALGSSRPEQAVDG